MSSQLSQLVELLAANVKELEATYSQAGQSVPSLDDLFKPSPLEMGDATQQNRTAIVAAANQLLHSVVTPLAAVQLAAGGAVLTTALGIVQDADVADLLLEAGPQGLHVQDISFATGVNQDILARFLRLLASRHIFKELSPNIFTNNRISSMFVKGKPTSELKADPLARFDKNPIANLLASMTDECLEIAPYMKEWVSNPEAVNAPFNLAKKSDSSYWEWLGQPGNEAQARRIATMMSGVASHFPKEIVTDSIDGNNLRPGAIVIDIGGGNGSATLQMYQKYPHLKYIIQDIESQAAPADNFWKASSAADAYTNGQVQFQCHDFFEPQPVKNADVYFTRLCIHDWADPKAELIMSRVREAAGPDSKFVVLDTLAMHTCADPDLPDSPIAPQPLMANYGMAGPAGFSALLDIQMLLVHNGKERTVADMRSLGEATGWKLQKVRHDKLMTYTFSPA